MGPVPRPSRPAALPQFPSISISTSIPAPCYAIRIHDNETQKNTIRPKDFILAHAFATLTTSSAFGETSVSILTPAPYSLDKFLQYTDTGSYWREWREKSGSGSYAADWPLRSFLFALSSSLFSFLCPAVWPLDIRQSDVRLHLARSTGILWSWPLCLSEADI